LLSAHAAIGYDSAKLIESVRGLMGRQIHIQYAAYFVPCK